MAVEIISRLPKGARVALDVPDFLLGLWTCAISRGTQKTK
jgi:hypothetical protein